MNRWDNGFFENLFGFEWELTRSPAGAHQWKPKGDAGRNTAPHAHDASRRVTPNMLTTDLALRVAPHRDQVGGQGRQVDGLGRALAAHRYGAPFAPKKPAQTIKCVKSYKDATLRYVRATVSGLKPLWILHWVWGLHKYPQDDSRGRPQIQK